MKFKWFVGIDISKKTLDFTLYNPKDYKNSAHVKISNSRDGFKELPRWLKKKDVRVNETLFCMEHTGIYGLELSVFFEEKELAYSAASPLEIKRSMGLTRGKNDKVDSLNISRYCYLHAGELELSSLPSGKLQSLKFLLNERMRVVKMQTVEKQSITEFEKYSPGSIIKRSKKRLASFIEQIKEIENDIESLVNKDESLKKNYNLVTSIVGMGMVNTVMFLVHTNNFTSFSDGRKYACYGGVAPFEYSSGTSIRGKTSVSNLANKSIKVNLTLAARSAVLHDSELKKYYKRKEEEGKEHGVIMNAVKFKLILRVFAVIKRGTPYVRIRQAG